MPFRSTPLHIFHAVLFLHLSAIPAIAETASTSLVSVVATDDQASENGNNSGVFTLTRESNLGVLLEVGLACGGAAINGIDYSAVASAVIFPPGINSAIVTISPVADSEIEVAETVELTILPGSGYVLSENSQAALLIKDLQSVVEVEILEPLASKDPLVPATLLIKRNGLTANSLFVLLDIGGSARNGIDFQYISAFVNFMPGQTSVPVTIMPLSGLGAAAETVILYVREDAAYALADTYSARIILGERRDSLDLWQDREFAGSTASPSIFAAGDESALGIGNLARYAYGMDPLAPDAALLPQLVFRDGRCQVDVHRNPCAMDVEFQVEVSTNLSHWNSTDVEKIIVPEQEGDAMIETYESAAPTLTKSNQFMRVRLIYEP